ncbi:hypothetical protein SLS56_001219 [Neofusicoccum ribis]|uniref:Major facilitator superfamily transporter n=1 Tax=Neofusicoccum ribis TaxID=45134 RepID=A0ABR3T9P7_9PEZI
MGGPGTQETAAESMDPALAPIPRTSTSHDGQPSRETSNIQLDETEEPLSWPASKKWLCTIVVVAMTATIGFCSSIHTAAIADIAKSFNCSRTVATLGVSTFLLGFATGPLIFGPLSEVDYWIVAIISGLSYIAMLAVLPETYTPVLLAKKRARLAGRQPADSPSPKIDYYTTLTRPWVMLFTEPILFLLSLYMAFCYGILYLDFTAYPIVFSTTRGWPPSLSGLSFLGIGLGMALSTACSPLINRVHTHYAAKLSSPLSPSSPPEARLPHLIPLAPLIPGALFWFARTAAPPQHWAQPVAAGVPFGAGVAALFLAIAAYLTDCYGRRYAASALAAAAVLRSLFGAAFPLFGPAVYGALGVEWAGCVLWCFGWRWLTRVFKGVRGVGVGAVAVGILCLGPVVEGEEPVLPQGG